MQNVEIAVPITMRGKWRRRATEFGKYGLLNTNRHKVRVVELRGPENIPGNMDATPYAPEMLHNVQWGPLDNASAKIHRYYALDLAFRERDADWYIRLDDDSVTDVGGLLDYLYRWFNPRDPIYLTAELINDLHELYKPMVDRVYPGLRQQHIPGDGVYHEWEIAVVSRGAMNRILGDRRALSLLGDGAEVTHGFGDHLFAVAAAGAGVAPAKSPVLSYLPQLSFFSEFVGGHGLFHIHGIAPDYPDEWYQYISALHRQGKIK